jgi:hypothetical protein
MTDLKAELFRVLRDSRATMLARLDGISEYGPTTTDKPR